MVDPFLIKLALSFIVGGLWITITTVAAERFGSKVGGVIGGLPSTVVVALFFIGFVQGTQAAAQATTTMPLIIGVNAFFLIAYAYLAKRGFAFAITVPLVAWFILSAIIVLVDRENFIFSLIAWLLLLLLAYHVLEKKMHIQSHGKLRIHYKPSHILWRAIFSGSIIAFAVFMSRVGGPIFGGIFASFPAAFISTLAITYKSRGIEFSRALTKPLAIGGTIITGLYPITARYFYQTSGLILGTIIPYAISVVIAYFVYNFINKRMT